MAEKNSPKNNFTINLFVLGAIFLLAAIAVTFLPLLVTKKAYFSWQNIGVWKPNEIGDTVGGIMGPAVGLIGAALTFLAFWVQIKANKEQREQFKQSLEQQKDALSEQTRQFKETLKHQESINNDQSKQAQAALAFEIKTADESAEDAREQLIIAKKQAKEAKEAYELQDNRTRRQQFDLRFYQMLSIHKSNVDELKFSYRVATVGESEDSLNFQLDEKRKVFKAVYSQYKELYMELGWLFSNQLDDIYVDEYLNALENNFEIKNRNIDLIELAKIDITYVIVFFGLGSEDKATIGNLLENSYQKDFISKVLAFASMKPVKFSSEWSKWNEIFKNDCFWDLKWFQHIMLLRQNYGELDLPNDWVPQDHIDAKHYNYGDGHVKYYGGHQHRLGHYFRQLFQIVQFIDREKDLNFHEKYSYAKLLRAQLSNYEQVIFCLNSLSQIGRSWELENKKKNSLSYKANRQYITKYNLIKNIPSRNAIWGVDLEEYYPDIDYETFKITRTPSRVELEKAYT